MAVTAAGISDNVIRFLLAADDVVVVTTREPTSITDVYALVKMALAQQMLVERVRRQFLVPTFRTNGVNARYDTIE